MKFNTKHISPGMREAFIWIAALVMLAWQPLGGTSLCGFHWLGFSHCPGCGIGTSIASALRGDFVASWYAHYFGIPAVVIILTRIYMLLKSNFIHLKTIKS